MRSLVDDVPGDEVVGQVSKIGLLALPLGVSAVADRTADNNERSVWSLDCACGDDLTLCQAVGNKVLLKLSLNELAALVSRLAVDAVFASAAVEEGSKNLLNAERTDNTKAPDGEAKVWVSDTVEQVFVKWVDEHDTDSVAVVSGSENARDDGTVAGRHKKPRTLLTDDCKSLGKCIGGHTGTVWAWSIVRPGVTWTVPVAVAVDRAVLVRGVGPVLKVILGRTLAGFDDHGWVLVSIAVVGDISNTSNVNLVLVAVDEDSLAIHFEGSIASAKDEGSGHEDNNDGVDGKNGSSEEDGQPLLESTASLWTTGEALFFLGLAPGDNAIGEDAPHCHQSSPYDGSDTRSALFGTYACNNDNDEHVSEEQ